MDTGADDPPLAQPGRGELAAAAASLPVNLAASQSVPSAPPQTGSLGLLCFASGSS